MLALGTAALGRPQYINLRQEETAELDLSAFREQGRQLLDYAYRSRIRYYDTAPGYGLAENLLIDWVQAKVDPSIEVATKWGYTYVANFDPNATQHEVKEHSLAKLKEQWAVSQRLLPYLTTYQIHSATFATGVLENRAVLDFLANLKTEHQLHIGLTTTGADQRAVLQAALEIEADGQPLFTAFQVTYNILDQSLHELLLQAQERGHRIIVKEALANGRLFPNERYPQYQELYEQLQQLAAKYAVGVDAIALRFCEDQLRPFTVLSGAARREHLDGNVCMEDIQLTTMELHQLRQFKVAPSVYWAERAQLGWQ